MVLVHLYIELKPFDPERFRDFVQHKFPMNVIRSKGLFWMASRPEQALIWGQAGGSLRTDSAGVWWASMSFSQRFNDPVFINHQNEIEKIGTAPMIEKMKSCLLAKFRRKTHTKEPRCLFIYP